MSETQSSTQLSHQPPPTPTSQQFNMAPPQVPSSASSVTTAAPSPQPFHPQHIPQFQMGYQYPQGLPLDPYQYHIYMQQQMMQQQIPYGAFPPAAPQMFPQPHMNGHSPHQHHQQLYHPHQHMPNVQQQHHHHHPQQQQQHHHQHQAQHKKKFNAKAKAFVPEKLKHTPAPPQTPTSQPHPQQHQPEAPSTAETSTSASTPSSATLSMDTPLTSAKTLDNNHKSPTVHTSDELSKPKAPVADNTVEQKPVSLVLPLMFGIKDETAFAEQKKKYDGMKVEVRLQEEEKKKQKQHQEEDSRKSKSKKTKKTKSPSASPQPSPAKAATPPPSTPVAPPAPVTPTKETVKTPEQPSAQPVAQVAQPKPMTGWAAIASQAAKKPTPKTSSASTSASASTTTTPVTQTKREERFVPVISNVLEPLGVVALRYMFDKNFQQRYADNMTLPQIVPRGLVNTGNICFMSSIVQMLLYCEPFYRSLQVISSKTIQSLSRDNSKSSLFDALVELYRHFNAAGVEKDENGFGDAVTPTEFYKSISQNERFQHLQWGQQEDAEEFLGYLLDGLHEEFTGSVKRLNDFEVKSLLNTTPDDSRSIIKSSLKKFQDSEFNSSETSSAQKNEVVNEDGWQEVVGGSTNKKTAKRTVEVKPSPIRQLFGGQFRSVLNFPKSKEAQSITLDPFQQIQLDISDETVNTLEEAFLKISEVEEIAYKSDAGADVLAKKQTFIDKCPEVLLIHLKRFSFVSNRRIEKLRKKIAYPHHLKIPQACLSPSTRKFLNNDDVKYRLTGVVYHHGMSSDGGHYTVDVLTSEEKWVRIDDVNITSLKPDEVINGSTDDVKTAYILMYQKV